ncbi:hypothetical protein BDW_06060 [Bdellovibrio bacteriovorus W]|nr:hypothetical protein BDW_06060 [Bdellovibrio bacteriovorus W]
MNLLNVIALLVFSIVSIGCSLEVATFKSEPPVSSDKPVFKSLVKHKLTGDFTANIQTFERYHASATDDAGNLYLMGTSVISNYGPVVRAFTATGEDKIDFGNQGYLYPGNAISILDSVSSTPLALSVIKKNGKTQIAVTIGVQTSIVYPNLKRGLKTLFFRLRGNFFIPLLVFTMTLPTMLLRRDLWSQTIIFISRLIHIVILLLPKWTFKETPIFRSEMLAIWSCLARITRVP